VNLSPLPGDARRFIAALLAVLAFPVFAFQQDVRVRELPAEARETLALIKRNGPFPYERDGVAFGNREALLPKRERGYYREFTVKTPGAKDRGARRIVAGKGGEYYYSDDHYRTFRRIIE
jgi:ribonuclease T1